MILNKYILVFSLIVLTVEFVIGQKKFEGKITQEIIYSNNAMANATSTTFYKSNKSRTELNNSVGDNPYTSVSVMDFEKGEMLMIMDMPKLKSKTATLMDYGLIERPNEKLEKFEEYKTILNHKCQKVIISTMVNGKETITKGYADLNYSIAAMIDLNGKTIDYPLLFEVEIVMPTMTMSMTITNISEEILPENLFSTNIPVGYKLTDIRKNKSQTITSSNNAISNKNYSSTNYIKTEDYSKYTDSELDEKLQAALKIEDFDTAEKLKEVIEKRGGTLFKYKSKSLPELQDMLKVAVSKEEFETATQIQEEIKKRSK
jgi:hypothetical protein